MADGGTYSQREGGGVGNRAGGGNLEITNINPSPPAHDDKTPWRTSRVPGGSRYRDGHPRGQAATTACSHEGGSPVCDLP